jgi:lysyl-tRNA synthetase class II
MRGVVEEEPDYSQHLYGDQDFNDEKFEFEPLNLKHENETAILGRVHSVRKVGKRLFLVMRKDRETIQIFFEKSEMIST